MDARFAFYNIDYCGYYEIGSNLSQFTNVSDTLANLENWIDGLQIDQTCTYSTKNKNYQRVFVFDLANNPNTGDWVITTWNETPSFEGAVASINPNRQVGDLDVSFTEVPPGDIPGYPSYFWVLPSQNLLATITFPNGSSGKVGLERLIQGYSAKWSPYVVRNVAATINHEILGYAANNSQEPKDLSARFRASLKRLPGDEAFLMSHYDEIHKIVKKNRLKTSKKSAETSTLQRLMLSLGYRKRQKDSQEIDVKYEFHRTPSQAELKEIISNFKNEEHANSWEDIGFAVGKQLIWLNNSIAGGRVNLNVALEQGAIIDAESLLVEISRSRVALVALAD